MRGSEAKALGQLVFLFGGSMAKPGIAIDKSLGKDDPLRIKS